MNEDMDTAHEAQEEAPVVRLRCGVMPARHHAKYTAQGGGCADGLDTAMRETFTDPKEGTDVDGLVATAKHNGIWNPAWASLNPGMIRMNTANRLRGLLRRGKEVTLLPTGGMATTGTFGVEPTTLRKEQERAAERAERKAAYEAKLKAIQDARQERRAAKAEAKAKPAPAPKAKAPAPKAKRGRK